MSQHATALAAPASLPHPPPPAAAPQPQSLWEEYVRTRSPKVRGQLETHYLELVRTLAIQLARKLPDCVDVNDLAQEGFLGLRRAVERYELRRAVKFTTYAQSAIWGAMMDSLRRDDFGTRNARRQATLLHTTRAALAGELERPATDDELAEALGICIEKLTAITNYSEASCITSLQSVHDQDSPGTRGKARQLPADDRSPDPAAVAQKNDLREMILRGFDPTERLLIILYYFEELTMREIGETLGISESRVSQLHTLLVARIRADLQRRKFEWQ